MPTQENARRSVTYDPEGHWCMKMRAVFLKVGVLYLLGSTFY